MREAAKPGTIGGLTRRTATVERWGPTEMASGGKSAEFDLTRTRISTPPLSHSNLTVWPPSLASRGSKPSKAWGDLGVCPTDGFSVGGKKAESEDASIVVTTTPLGSCRREPCVYPWYVVPAGRGGAMGWYGPLTSDPGEPLQW